MLSIIIWIIKIDLKYVKKYENVDKFNKKPENKIIYINAYILYDYRFSGLKYNQLQLCLIYKSIISNEDKIFI